MLLPTPILSPWSPPVAQLSSHLNLKLIPFLDSLAQAHGGHQPSIWGHTEGRTIVPFGDLKCVRRAILWGVWVIQDQLQDFAANGGVLLRPRVTGNQRAK